MDILLIPNSRCLLLWRDDDFLKFSHISLHSQFLTTAACFLLQQAPGTSLSFCIWLYSLWWKLGPAPSTGASQIGLMAITAWAGLESENMWNKSADGITSHFTGYRILHLIFNTLNAHSLDHLYWKCPTSVAM